MKLKVFISQHQRSGHNLPAPLCYMCSKIFNSKGAINNLTLDLLLQIPFQSCVTRFSELYLQKTKFPLRKPCIYQCHACAPPFECAHSLCTCLSNVQSSSLLVKLECIYTSLNWCFKIHHLVPVDTSSVM